MIPAGFRRLSPIAVIALVLMFISGTPEAQQDDSARILKMISDFADRICPQVPLEGGSSTFELSGQAKAELASLLKRFTDIGLQGAAKYQQQQFQGLLQKDLLTAMRDTTNCRMTVANTLMGKLLGAATAPRLPDNVREDLSRFVLEGNNLLHRLVTTDRNEAAEKQIQAQILDWHNRVEQYLSRPPIGVTYLARFRTREPSAIQPMNISENLIRHWRVLTQGMALLTEFIKER
jgi:hypothetical protein